jgi:hypothetical protein
MVNELWGEGGPYSQAQLITEVRIMDDKISRTFVIVSVNINPFTMKYIRKHPSAFKGDRIVTGIVEHAVYEGPKDGYALYLFQQEYHNEEILKEAKAVLNEVNNAIIRMHSFVMQYLKGGTKKRNDKAWDKIDKQRQRSMGTQKIMCQCFIDRYLMESGKNELADIQEANMVVERVMNWWNHKLKTSDRKRIETLSAKEQRKTFMEANVDFSGISGGKSTASERKQGEGFAGALKADPDGPCPCGSGKKFEQCCLLKMH